MLTHQGPNKAVELTVLLVTHRVTQKPV